VDLARLRRAGARPAGPPPAGPSPGALAASKFVEVDRLVNGIGGVTLLNRLVLVGVPLAGQRARLRLDGQLMHVITQDGQPWRTLPCPIPPGQRHRLQSARLASPAPLPPAAVTVQRRVSSRAASWSPSRRSRRGCPTRARSSRGLRPMRPARKGGDPMPDMKLDANDAAELAEMQQFLSGWLARDPGRLGASLGDFAGNPA
jgi:hypothetical protein